MTKGLILIAVAFGLTATTLGWMLRTYLPGATLGEVFVSMTLVLKLLAVIIVVATGVGVVGGLRRNAVRVRMGAVVSILCGLLGAIHGELNIHFGMLIDNVVNFETLAPARVESLAILALGLLGGLLALGSQRLGNGSRRGL